MKQPNVHNSNEAVPIPMRNLNEQSGLDLQDSRNAPLLNSELRKQTTFEDGFVRVRPDARATTPSAAKVAPENVSRILSRLHQLGMNDFSAAQLTNRLLAVVHDFSDEEYLWNQFGEFDSQFGCDNRADSNVKESAKDCNAGWPNRRRENDHDRKTGRSFSITATQASWSDYGRYLSCGGRCSAEDLRGNHGHADGGCVDSDEMRHAVAKLSDQELIFIDTAGRNPKNKSQLQQLKATVAAADSDQVHLVLSTTTSEATLRSTVRRFESVGCNSMILTKIDETETLVDLALWLLETALPISYFTYGQAVPDDIQVAEQREIANLILGGTQ